MLDSRIEQKWQRVLAEHPLIPNMTAKEVDDVKNIFYLGACAIFAIIAETPNKTYQSLPGLIVELDAEVGKHTAKLVEAG